MAEDALAGLEPEAQCAVALVPLDEDVHLAVPHELAVTALRNLLENAQRFSPAVGSVRLVLLTEASGLTFEVRDRGPGVDAASLTKLTGRFWRQGQGHGSGLGLAIVAAIAERFAGRVSFAHDSPQGLVARLWFPRLDSRRRPQGPLAAPGESQPSINDNKRPQAGWYPQA